MLKLFISDAYAQGGAIAGQPSTAMNFVPIILVVAIFYFLVFRPQKKQIEEEKKLLSSLEKGKALRAIRQKQICLFDSYLQKRMLLKINGDKKID